MKIAPDKISRFSDAADATKGSSGDRHEIIVVPLLVWAALLTLAMVSLGYAYWREAPGRFEFGLAIAVIKSGLIALVFMQLTKASGVVRIASIAGLFFLSLLFLFSFADFVTR